MNKETVPFFQANLKQEQTVGIGTYYAELDERKVEVTKLVDNKGVVIRIFRPTDDGKISKLSFGLTLDAARSLSECLAAALRLEK